MGRRARRALVARETHQRTGSGGMVERYVFQERDSASDGMYIARRSSDGPERLSCAAAGNAQPPMVASEYPSASRTEVTVKAHLLFLLESPARSCSVPHRDAGPGTRAYARPVRSHDDRDGEITAPLGRRTGLHRSAEARQAPAPSRGRHVVPDWPCGNGAGLANRPPAHRCRR